MLSRFRQVADTVRHVFEHDRMAVADAAVNVLDHLAEMFEGSDEWKELCELQYKPAELPGGPERQAVCDRLAEILETHADRMERTKLVRWLASSFTPDGLRAEAALWRQGVDPWEGQRGE